MIPYSISRWTARSFVQPNQFVESDAIPKGFSLEEWARDYRWESDGEGLSRDVIAPIEETVRTASGDCDDFAVVSASWAIREHRDRVGFAYLWESGTDWWPTHMVAYDSERVYSTAPVPIQGQPKRIADIGLTDWVARSDYYWAIRRQIRYW